MQQDKPETDGCISNLFALAAIVVFILLLSSMVRWFITEISDIHDEVRQIRDDMKALREAKP